LVARVTAPDGAFGARFGASAAVEGEVLAVGAPLRDEPSFHAGVVYVFLRDASGYRMSQKLLNPWKTAHFGWVLAFFEGRLLASRSLSPSQDLPFWFERRGGAFVAAGTLAPPPAAGPIAHFGNAFAVRGDRLLVAARGTYVVPGRAFLYRSQGGALALEHRFDPESSPEFEPYNFYMGEIVAFDDRRAVLVATLDPSWQSAIVVFRRVEDDWKHEQTLSAPSGDVAMSGSLLLASSGPSRPVTVYREVGSHWATAGELPPSEGVAMEGDLAALSNGSVLRWDGARFVEVQRLTREGGRAFTGSGWVKLQGGLIIVGKPGDDGKGAVYVYEAER
jgi:hypothetical protein